MSDFSSFLFPCLTGVGTACFFLYGLWMTVKCCFHVGGKASLFVKGFFFRLVVAISLLLWVCRTSASAWMYAMGSFYVTRILILKTVLGSLEIPEVGGSLEGKHGN